MPLAAVAEALAHAEPEAGRQEVLAARGGFTVVNDAYNANPDSMRASLATFCALEVPGRRVAVLGDMGELGDFARACHVGIGELAANAAARPRSSAWASWRRASPTPPRRRA